MKWVGNNTKSEVFIVNSNHYCDMKIVFDVGGVSSYFLEEKLNIDHTRAVNIVDQMELLGLVGTLKGSSLREVLIDKDEWQRLYGRA